MSPHANNISQRRPVPRLKTKQHCQKVCNMILQSNPHIKNGFIYHRVKKNMNEKDPVVESEHRADRYLFYLTGVEDPDYHVLININTTQVYLITPSILDDDYLWKCPPDKPSKLLKLYDVDVILEETDLYSQFLLLQPTIIYTLNTTDISLIPKQYHSCIINNNETTTDDDDNDLGHILDECRLIKFKWEIQVIRQVCYASSQAHIALMKNAYPGQPEFELVALFKWICARYGVSRQAYLPIVVSGKRTAVLHETRHNYSLPTNKDAMVLVDAGGEQLCYSADITRCYPVTGKFSLEAKIIYEIVLKIQETVLSYLKPGIIWNDMEMLALRILCEELCKIGILIGDVDELIELNIPTTFYYHKLGHPVGLDVHDVGGRKLVYDDDSDQEILSSFLEGRALETNMVITVEPGIYFNDRWIQIWTQCPGYEQYFDLEKIKQYSVIGGIRIEDTVVITESGYENLTTVPKSIQDIENLMASSSSSGSDGSLFNSYNEQDDDNSDF